MAEPASDSDRSLRETAEELFLAGVGVVALTKDRADELVEELVGRGKVSREDAKEVVDEVIFVIEKGKLGDYEEALLVTERHGVRSHVSLDIFPQAYNAGRPIFRGVFEGNDVEKRMQMFIAYNTDISQYWEWSGQGIRPIDDTNEAYKLGVNYIVYGLSH